MIPLQPKLLRDQERALYAYQQVASVPSDDQGDYEIALQTFSGALVRSGLAAAIAALERIQKRKGTKEFLKHLAGAGIPGLANNVSWDTLGDAVRGLDLDRYMLATREILRLVAWFRRAVQAKFD
jgi:CRISPR-associated protein Cmr5